MIKNIMLLTKISTSNFFKNINIIDTNKKTLNKKSSVFWMFLIILIAVFYISYQVLNVLQEYGQINIFPNIYITFIFILLFFQTILICANVFYFSEDIENLITYPIKPIELFLAKFNTILSILYGTEAMAMFVPMFMYGSRVNGGFLYIISLLILMLLLPIFIVAIVSFINLFMVNFIKLFKNKNIYQLFVTSLLIIIVCLGEYIYIKNILIGNQGTVDTLISVNDIAKYINSSLLIINPLLEILQRQNIFINILKIIVIYLLILIPLVIIGNKIYFKKILSTTTYNKKKNAKKIALSKECKPSSLTKAYIKNEWKYVTRNMIFLIQYIMPILMLLTFSLTLSIYFKVNILAKNEHMLNSIQNMSLTIEGFCAILGLCQILFSLSTLSMTSISRQGKSAFFIKYIPISLYKQFWLKNVIQIILGILVSIVVLFVFKLIMTHISMFYIVVLFIDILLVNILNSNVMVIVDLKRPILNWKNEYEVIKQNSNKFFQYVYTIYIVLILMYMVNIFKDINFNIAIIAISIILMIFILLVNVYVKNQIKKNKLFKNIS